MPGRFVARAGILAVAWLLTGAFYLLLIDLTSLPELLTGAVVVTLAVVGFELARERDVADERLPRGGLKRVLVPFLTVPRDAVLLIRAALAQLVHPRAHRGTFRVVPFRRGDEQSAAGRRALAESLGSVSPNTIVVGIDVERELIMVHQLQHRGDRSDLDPLRLG